MSDKCTMQDGEMKYCDFLEPALIFCEPHTKKKGLVHQNLYERTDDGMERSGERVVLQSNGERVVMNYCPFCKEDIRND